MTVSIFRVSFPELREIQLVSWVSLSDLTFFGYIGKAKVINRAMQDIGMGKYQYKLFFLCGFGWLADK